MKLEKQVSSLEPSRRLKELGVAQESYFIWVNRHYRRSVTGSNPCIGIIFGTDMNRAYGGEEVDDEMLASAFTVAELGDMLPAALGRTSTWLTIERMWGGDWLCSYVPDSGEPEAPKYGPFEGTEADARAKMLIYLIENNLIAELLK